MYNFKVIFDFYTLQFENHFYVIWKGEKGKKNYMGKFYGGGGKICPLILVFISRYIYRILHTKLSAMLYVGLGKINQTALNCQKLHWTKKQFAWTVLNWKTVRTNWTELFFLKINCTELHCTELHYNMNWTVINWTVLWTALRQNWTALFFNWTALFFNWTTLFLNRFWTELHWFWINFTIFEPNCTIFEPFLNQIALILNKLHYFWTELYYFWTVFESNCIDFE